MKQILILSDTHGILRDEVLAECATSDIILHAGDAHTPAIVESLQSFAAPLHMVRGNNDKEWAGHLPQTLTVEIEGLRFFLIHNKSEVPKDLTGIDVVVYGHSHKYSVETLNGVLWLNPGSCGKRRFDLELSLCRMTVDQGSYQLEKLLIPTRPLW